MNNLVLSIFPGIDVAGKGFEEQGCCVVRGPDPLWGGNILDFHPPAGVFWGVIGGPPCQAFSKMRTLNVNAGKHGDLIGEYCRVVEEAQPEWFVMENVEAGPLPVVPGYEVWWMLLDNRWLGEEQQRCRRFSFGTRDGRPLQRELRALEHPRHARTVSAGHGDVMSHERGNRTIQEMCRLQGLPEDFTDEMPVTMHGKRQVVGNAWTLPMSRAIAKAVLKAMA